MKKNTPTGLTITQGKGFQLTFPNGYTISVQFGPINYCRKRSIKDINAPIKELEWSSPNAEIAVWDKNGDFTTRDFFDGTIKDDVVGWMKPNDIAALIAEVAKK